MFKALLLATWYDLSDVALSEALADRASFRRFCGFSRDEETPERTAFVRFRRLLVEHGLDRSLFAAIARDLEAKGATVRKGTSPQSLTAIASLIDATVIGSAAKGDKEAAWVRHRTRAPAHGCPSSVSVRKEVESDESVVIQGRRPDSRRGRQCGRQQTARNTIVTNSAIRAT
jgi:transposase, IS5 family